MNFLIVLISFNALLFLIFKINFHEILHNLELVVFARSLVFTLLQAVLSATASVFLGLIAAPGFARLGLFKKPASWIFLLPNIMSSVLAVLCLLLTFENFPYGLWGIVLGHVFINSGLCAVWLGAKWAELENRWEPVGRVVGAKEMFLFSRGILPMMIPQIRNTFAVVFALCLSSFAIPLVLGGGPQASTLEVLIYESIHTSGDVSSALALSIIQCLLQFVVYLVILRPLLLKTEYSKFQTNSPWFSLWTLLTLIVLSISLVPLLKLVSLAIAHLSEFKNLIKSPEFIVAAKNSLIVSSVVGVLTFLLLALLAGWGWNKKLTWLPTLSGVVVGLAGVLIFRTSGVVSSWRLIEVLVWGHMAVIFLSVFRLSAPRLEALRNRYDLVLKQTGADKLLGFKKVYLKLGAKVYLAGGVLAACWSMGEFSVSRLVGASQSTLPLYVQSLLGHYRLEQAALSALILLVLSIVSMTMLEVITDGLG
ncbi:MAG: hypothetical protein SGI74_00940 [Oligoflexia bacterium]|nr:hypothetical protein [Oligoflexia bacterium]